MKQLQTRMITIAVAGIIVIAVVLTSIAGAAFGVRMTSDTARILNLESERNVEILNGTLRSAEQSLDVIKIAVDSEITSAGVIRDDESRERVTRAIEKVALYQAQNTQDATAVYLRFDPEIAPSTSGFFITETGDKKGFKSVRPTDITAYDPDDDAHVAWWYRTIEAGKASWIKSYMNKNNGINMISYTIPVYAGKTFIGVVGIDLRLDYIKQIASDIQVFDTGHAILLENGVEIYPEKDKYALSSENIKTIEGLKAGSFYDYESSGTSMKLVSAKLRNGMTLAITAPTREINEQIRNFVILAIIISIAVLLLVWFFVNRLARKAFQHYQKETRSKEIIIRSLSSIYLTAIEIDVQDAQLKVLRIPEFMEGRFSVDGRNYEGVLDDFLEKCVSEAYRKPVREFLEFESLVSRLADSAFMQLEYVGLTRGWCRITIVPVLDENSDELGKLVLAIANINDEKEREKEIRFRAEHDELTRLLNRTAFEGIDGITNTLASPDVKLGIIVMDVDKFKNVNDGYGHAIGDAALKKVADTLKETFRKTDYIVRYGGDEFLIVLMDAGLEDYQNFHKQIGEINRKLAIETGDGVPALSVSAGIAFSESGYSDRLFKQADKALYHTKTHGRAGCTCYEGESNQA